MPLLDPSGWNSFLERFPNAHLFQTAPWGDLKTSFGWSVARFAAESAPDTAVGAQVLFRRLPLGLSFAYIPKGPLLQKPGVWCSPAMDHLLSEINAACQANRSVFLKVEPDLWEGDPGTEPAPTGFKTSSYAIQPRRTLVVDLKGSEERILARMKQKTRYNIKLAQKKGVVVHTTAEIDTFNRLMHITGGRDGFGVHSPEYYRRVYELFQSRGRCELLMAFYEGEPLAGLMVFSHGDRAWYFYGASASAHRDRMPSYLLQWEAMRWAKARGCTLYDLWGIPDEDEQTLESDFSRRSDGLWGVYRFKRGFGGSLCRASAPLDRVYYPSLYKLIQIWLSRREA
jgi:peptidoglycan pentaglycine glycine transferase (the first glycine)